MNRISFQFELSDHLEVFTWPHVFAPLIAEKETR
jgi:hypothetical protein